MAADAADRKASHVLFTTLYRELDRVAAHPLRRGSSQTPGARTVLHECSFDMSGRPSDFPDQARFVGDASRAMCGLNLDRVHERKAIRRGGGVHLTAPGTGSPTGRRRSTISSSSAAR